MSSNGMSHDRIGQERNEIFQTEEFAYDCLDFVFEMSDEDAIGSPPSDRRRKRSAIFSSPPSFPSVEEGNEIQHERENNEEDTNENNVDTREHIHEQTRILDSTEKAAIQNGENHDEVDWRNEKQLDDSTDKIDNTYDINQNGIGKSVKEEPNINNNNNINDIEYDETKPKRLPNPKKLQLDIQDNPTTVLHNSINYLISPDDDEAESPGRRRRRQNKQALVNTKSEPDFKTRRASPVNVRHESEARIVHLIDSQYQRSPDLHRRKISKGPSPIQKKIDRCASPSTAHRMKRKISSDARIGLQPERVQVKMPPKRKISSNARLVGYVHEIEERKNNLSVDEVRTRKVSFDTTALVNGRRTAPLNDEMHLHRVQEASIHEHPDTQKHDSYYLPETDEDHRIQNSVPKVYVTPDADTELYNSHQLSEYDEDDDPFDQADANDTDSIGFDNKAYIADDEDSINHSTTPPPPSNYNDYTDYDNGFQTTSPRRIKRDQPAVIPHTTVESLPNGKKASNSSLPVGIGSPGQTSFEEGFGPKSILKTRREDSESMLSQESLNDRKFKVRKDSIALFTSHNGQVELQKIQQQYKSQWSCLSCCNPKELWANRDDLFVRYKLHLLVLMLFTMTFAFVIVGLHLHSVHHDNLAIAKKIFFDAKRRRLSLPDEETRDTFRGTLGKDIPAWMSPTHCFQNYQDIHDKTCLKWKGHAQLDIAYFVYNNIACYNVSWITDLPTAPYDCFDIGSGYWYGPVNVTDDTWPTSKSSFTFSVKNAKHYNSGTFSSAVEYYWISSNGWAILFDAKYPVDISWNKDTKRAICMKGKESGDFYNNKQGPVPKFAYTVCNGVDIKDTHLSLRERYFPKPQEIPARSLLKYPHWSSVADSDSFILNSTTVTNLVENITKYDLKCGTVEIDGKWEIYFGDLKFNQRKFKNMSDIVNVFNENGCDISLNIYPFFGFLSQNFQEGVVNQYFIMDSGKSVPALLKWEHGVGAMVDVSKSEAKDWLMFKLSKLKSDFDIKVVRLTYGNAAWVPSSPQFHEEEITPSKVKHLYTDLVSSLGSAIVQSTSQSQHLNGIIAIPSTIVAKNDKTCLRNLIPDIINFGLMGYPFIMVDGIEIKKDEFNSASLPSKDLFIRWMQFSTFLPALKYTVKPWTYGEEVVNAARNLSIFHDKIIEDLININREVILNGLPIIRPLWWTSPKNSEAYKYNDEFLLFDNFLVAPILCEASDQDTSTKRDIYVPEGVWKDMINDKIIIGPRLIKQYPVLQYEVPYFEKMPQYR